MGRKQNNLVLSETSQELENLALTRWIEAGARFVQNDERRVMIN